MVVNGLLNELRIIEEVQEDVKLFIIFLPIRKSIAFDIISSDVASNFDKSGNTLKKLSKNDSRPDAPLNLSAAFLKITIKLLKVKFFSCILGQRLIIKLSNCSFVMLRLSAALTSEL